MATRCRPVSRTFGASNDPGRAGSRRAVLLLIAAAALWSSSGLLIKIVDWSALSIISGRSMTALLVFLWYLRRLELRFSRIELAGGLSYVGVQLFFVLATKQTAAANAIFLQYTAPIYLLFFGYWFLGERPERSDWVSIPIIFLGLVLFLGDGIRFSGIQGNILGALSGAAMAAMMVAMRKQKSEAPARMILLGCLLSIAVGLPSLARESFSFRNVGIILFMGIFQMGLPYVFFSIAIKHLAALESSLVLFIEPVLNPVWVFLVIGEVPGPLALAGGALVIGTAVVRALVSSRKNL
jgi:drug/metabolite transporter (DMT)-like permease